VDRYWKPISAKYGRVVGSAAGDFTQKGPDRAEYNLVADAVKEELGLECDLENLAGVRAPLVKGPITYGDMVTLDPFGNTIVTFRATGRQLKQILARNRPAVSGIRYVVEGNRLVESSINGKPIEDDRVYSGATNSYWAPFILSGITDKTDTGKARLDVVLEYIRKKGTIHPSYDGRRVLREVGDFD
jgi:2',3'-cyclic-nucleotide 2'-phosphodiesterase (5'-nucleotidase family)